MKRFNNLPQFKERRQELRKNSTSEEDELWQQLKYKRSGFKFKRQHS
ncbi:DUF559 domain-containing protein, partial [Candidatus Parcubacteria bacterium]|nr:DUF559 domain-containing protein [Candidatus Parcubacteria bacterium]